MMQRRIYFTFNWTIGKQQVINRRVSEDVVLDLGEGDRIVGIEFLDASKHLNLGSLLPVRYGASPEAA
jgi:uncharacterized protein YuzE